MGLLDKLFESKVDVDKRKMREQFALQAELTRQETRLDRALHQSDEKIRKNYADAESYKAVGNSEMAMSSYKRYLSAKNARTPLEKSLYMTEALVARVKAGSITGDICGVLTKTIKSTNFNINAIRDLAVENSILNEVLNEVEQSMAAVDSNSEDMLTEAAANWLNGENNSSVSNQKQVSKANWLEEGKAKIDQLKRG